MCFIGCVYWKLVYVAVNLGSVHYRVCVLEIGGCGCKGRHLVLRKIFGGEIEKLTGGWGEL